MVQIRIFIEHKPDIALGAGWNIDIRELVSSPRDDVLVGGGQGGGIVSSMSTAILCMTCLTLVNTQSQEYHSLKCLSRGVDDMEPSYN